MLMRINGFVGLVISSVLFMGLVAHASTLNMTYNGVSGNNPTLTINDPTLGTVTGYIDPYHGTIGGQSVLLWCVDPDQDAPPVGTTWSANIGTPGNLSSMNTTFQVLNNLHTNSQANALYEEMASLILLLQNPSNTKVQDQEIQAAIWQLADPKLTFPSPPAGFSTTQVGSYETYASYHPLTGGFEVLTDTKDTYQEYIVLTPEPSTLFLLGIGFVCLVSFQYWRQRTSQRAIS